MVLKSIKKYDVLLFKHILIFSVVSSIIFRKATRHFLTESLRRIGSREISVLPEILEYTSEIQICMRRELVLASHSVQSRNGKNYSAPQKCNVSLSSMTTAHKYHLNIYRFKFYFGNKNYLCYSQYVRI